MDWLAPLVFGLGSLFAVLAATARYLLNRLTRLEAERTQADIDATARRDADNTALRAEVQTLRQRVADGERREGVTRAEMDTTRTELNELHASLKTAMHEIAALREQVTTLEEDLSAERDEKAKLEARVKALVEQVTLLEATAARLTIERDTLAALIRGKMDAGERGVDASADEAQTGKPSTKDQVERARRVSAEHEARHPKTGEGSTTDATGSEQQGG